MTKKIVSATAVLIGVGSLMMGCSTEQPSAGCIVQDSPSWFVTYTLDPASITGANCTAESAAAGLKGETLGVFKFVDPNNRSDVKLVLRPNGLASRAIRDPGDPYLQNAVGKMSATPDAADFCAASEFSTASVNDPGTATVAATNIAYEFNSISVYAAPNVPGTQLKGELTYTRDGCTAKYAVAGTWPAVSCVPGSEKPAESCGAGSGANPDFDLRCDAGLKVCVPAKEIPSLK